MTSLNDELVGIVQERRRGVFRFYPLGALTIGERLAVCRTWDRRTSLREWRGTERRSA